MGQVDIIGWDIGGAHLKAARCAGGRITAAVQIPCPLWLGVDRLDAALQQAQARLGGGTRHVATMTGELADVFASRAEGIARITESLATALGDVAIYGGRAGWLPAAAAPQHATDIASANWHASASLAALHSPDALFVDIGSTTTDLITIAGGIVQKRGYTDAERLASGALVYIGLVRTPLMALAHRAPFDGRWVDLAAEHFATTADIYRILGTLPDGADQHPSADNRAKTADASRVRLARMLGQDARDAAPAAWDALAAWLAEAQLRRIHDAGALLLSAALLPDEAPVIGAGVGAFLARQLAERLQRPYRDFSDVIGQQLPDIGTCAPAASVALLAFHRGR